MTEAEILSGLRKTYGVQIRPNDTLPKAYCPGGLQNVKAIYLGCDPSNKHSETLPYVFAQESGLKIFNSFIKAHTEQLEQIGLDWNCVYTQNLCRNYFTYETAVNPIWFDAAKIWLPILKEELDSIFPASIPLLMTAEALYKILLLADVKNHKAKNLYTDNTLVPIPPEDNFLERQMIPLYRGGKGYYNLDKWEKYRTHVRILLSNMM